MYLLGVPYWIGLATCNVLAPPLGDRTSWDPLPSAESAKLPRFCSMFITYIESTIRTPCEGHRCIGSNVRVVRTRTCGNRVLVVELILTEQTFSAHYECTRLTSWEVRFRELVTIIFTLTTFTSTSTSTTTTTTATRGRRVPSGKAST